MKSIFEYSTDFGSGRIHYYKNLKTGKMIIKCVNKRFGYSISINGVYPIISYKKDSHDNVISYQIYDSTRSLSYIPISFTELLHDFKSNHIKFKSIDDNEEFIYNDLYYADFYKDFYSESEKSGKAEKLIKNSLINMYANECAKDELISFLGITQYNDENYELMIKAFFKDVKQKNRSQLASFLYNKALSFDEELIKLLL